MKSHIVIFNLRKPTLKVSSDSIFAKYARKNFGLIAREFSDKDLAIDYIKHFMTAKGSYTTTTEDMRLSWSSKSTNNQKNLFITLQECDPEDIQYLLFISENQVQTQAYECTSRKSAIRQANKILDENDLAPTEAENDNGYWCGISNTGAEIVIELRLAIRGEQYLNINPLEILTAKEQDIFANAPVETLNKRQAGFMLVTQIIILMLSIASFVITRANGIQIGYLPEIFIVVTIVVIIDTLRKA